MFDERIICDDGVWRKYIKYRYNSKPKRDGFFLIREHGMERIALFKEGYFIDHNGEIMYPDKWLQTELDD